MVNLAQFQKPSRYIGGEINSVSKQANLNIALAFPDVYEVGMSHLGIKILYHIINSLPHASAQRVFHPWPDMQQYMQASGMELCSLESGMPLKRFDVVGFSLQYELSYPTVLNMLSLGGIPLRASDRGDGLPMVIAGGPCTSNPMPMLPFMDAFLIGDGEEAVLEIIGAVNEWKTNPPLKKEHLLKALSNIEGVFVPEMPRQTRRRYIKDLNTHPYPVSPAVPFAEIIHDRVNVEVARGCGRGCRFCQAGMIYRPVREKSPQLALQQAGLSLKSTGYQEVSFTSLSTGDYSCLLPLLKEFNRRFSESKISVSLPSLRVKSVNEDVLREIRSVRKTGFTIAPEAATERLRAVINKDLSGEDFQKAVSTLFREEWKNLKLYYMIGLPEERDEDIEAIAEMARYAARESKKTSGRSANVSVSVSPFVPKPHTPFQWTGQADMQYIKEKKAYLNSKLRNINIRGHDERTSMLEAAISRGDSLTAELIEAAHKGGARLDAWSECFDFSIWQRAMDKTGIDASLYAKRALDTAGPLPWDIIDAGVKKSFLHDEYINAKSGITTKDCMSSCSSCGLACKAQKPSGNTIKANIIDIESAHRGPIRIRAEFSKTGTMRYLSHRELINHITRGLMRAGVRLQYSKGFHPAPKISFGPPLPVGVSGLREHFDMEMEPGEPLSSIRQRLNKCLSEGIEVAVLASISPDARSLQEFIKRYEYDVSCSSPDSAMKFMSHSEYFVERDGKPVDIRPMAEEARMLSSGRLKLILKDTEIKKVRLDEMINAVLGGEDRPDVTRVNVFGFSEGRWSGPMEGAGVCQTA